MKKIIIAGILGFLCFSVYSQVEIGGIKMEVKEKVKITKKQGAWTGGGGESFPTMWITLNSGKFVYEIRHDQKYGKGAIGLSLPTIANWYQSGMFNILINGERFNFLPENNEKVEVEEGDIGKIKFSWENDITKVFLNFYLFSLDDKLFMEILLEPKQEIKSIEIRFWNLAGGNNKNPRHVIYTAGRNLTEKGWNKINFSSENWLLLTDENMNYPEVKDACGPSAIAYLPEDIIEEQIYLGGHGCTLSFKYKPTVRRVIFTLWEFPEKTNQEVAEKIKSYIPDAMEKMKKIQKGEI